jgi:hypothetical protein
MSVIWKEIYRLRIQIVIFWILKNGAVCYSETLESTCNATCGQRYKTTVSTLVALKA